MTFWSSLTDKHLNEGFFSENIAELRVFGIDCKDGINSETKVLASNAFWIDFINLNNLLLRESSSVSPVYLFTSAKLRHKFYINYDSGSKSSH